MSPKKKQAPKIQESPNGWTLPVFTCKKCGHKWTPRKLERPTVCPKCKKYTWDRD